MKREVGMNDKKAIILQVLALNQVQLEKKQRKIEIYKCLQFTQGGGGAYYKHQLADWILKNYFQLKANSHMFLQYGNLKYLSKQSRECIEMLFKKCQQKFGSCMSQDDFYTSLLMRNPYLGYQPLPYMYPPYGMPTMSGVPNSYPNTGTNMENYQKMYNRQMQQYYMQMSKYGYQMNPMYMPQMPYGMQQYSNQQNVQNMAFSNKNFQSSYGMMQAPTQQPITTSKTNQKNLKSTLHLPQQVSSILKQPAKIIRQNLIQKPPQSLLTNNKKPIKQRPKTLKTSPSQIKTTYKQIKQIKQMKQHEQYKKNPTQTNQQIFSLNDNNQDSQIQIIQKPSQTLAVQPKKQKKLQPNINPIPTNEQIRNIPITVHYSYQNSQLFKNKMLEQQRIRKYLRDIKTISAPHPQKYYKQQFKYCVCNGFGDHTQFYTCTECYRNFHYYCVGKKTIPLTNQQNNQKCHFCFIKALDPLNKIQKQIKTSYILDIRKNKFNQIIDFQLYDSYFNKNSAYQIQMRCLRLDDASNYVVEYTWPDQSFICVNQQKTAEFPALQHNSSLKKRKDMSIFLTNPIYSLNKTKIGDRKNTTVSLQMKNINSLQSNQKKIRNNYIYVLGIYLTLKKTPDELCLQIINDPTNKINYIQKYFAETAKQQDLQIQRIKVTLLDPFTWNIIDIPVRGRKCKHGQCFDLKTFLIFMNVQQVRQWKCPVCNRQCRNFHIDSQQINVIKQYKKQQNTFSNNNKLSKQIQFHRDGTTIFVALKQQQQLDSKSKNNQQVHKTKKIVKTNIKEEKSAKDHNIEQEN